MVYQDLFSFYFPILFSGFPFIKINLQETSFPFLHPASAKGVRVLTSSVCVCLCVRLTLLAEGTNVETFTLACKSGLSISKSS